MQPGQRRRSWSAGSREVVGEWVVRHCKGRKIDRRRSADADHLDFYDLDSDFGAALRPPRASSLHHKHPKDLVGMALGKRGLDD
jgi:hypothetical protein